MTVEEIFKKIKQQDIENKVLRRSVKKGKSTAFGFGDADLTDMTLEAIIEGRNITDVTSEGKVLNKGKTAILRSGETLVVVELGNNEIPTISVDDAGKIFPEKTHKKVKRILNKQRSENRLKRIRKTNAR